MRRAEATLQVILDMMLEGGLIALVVFTPLAFGTVQTWALSLMQAALILLFALWLVRVVWSRPPSRPAQVPAAGEGFVTCAGYRFIRTRLGLPILLFLALVAFQLVPVPQAVARVVSPRAAELFARSLPGWEEGKVDFSRWDAWLGEPAAGMAERLLDASGTLPVSLPLTSSSARPLSIYPHETMARALTLLALLMAFLVALHTLRDLPQIERFCWVVILAGLGLSVIGMVQRLGGNGLIYGFYPVPEGASPFGPFFNHNHFAAYLEMAFPIALGMFFWWLGGIGREAPPAGDDHGDEPRRSWLRALPRRVLREGPDVLARLGLSGFACVVMLAALVLSGSRGAVISLAASCLVYGALMAWRGQLGRREAIAGAGVVAATLAMLLWVGPGHLGEMTRKLESVAEFESEPSLSARVIGWRATLGIVADYPAIGSGLGTFPEAWLRYYPPGTANVWKETHNDYLQIASETGLAGAVLLAWGLVIVVRHHLFVRGSPNPMRGAQAPAPLRHGLAIGLLSILLHSLVDFSLQVGAIALLFVVLTAVLMSENRRQAEAWGFEGA